MRALTWIVLLASLLGGGATPAHALLCKTKSGAVLLRDACRAKESTVEMSVVGPAGAPGPKGADGPAGRTPLQMVDASGAAVGPVVNAAWYVPVAAESLPGERLIYVLVQPEAAGGAALLPIDYVGLPAGTVYWSMANCTGDGLAAGDTFLPVLEVIGNTLFVPGEAATSVTIGSVERVNDQAGCTSVTSRGGCCQSAGGTLPGARLLSATSFDTLGIVPPLRAVAP